MDTWMLTTLAAAFVAGLALGTLYFIALWQTVRRLSKTAGPVKWLVVSFAARLSVLLAGLYFVMDGRLERLAAAMVGFILMRKILTTYLKPPKTVQVTT